MEGRVWTSGGARVELKGFVEKVMDLFYKVRHNTHFGDSGCVVICSLVLSRPFTSESLGCSYRSPRTVRVGPSGARVPVRVDETTSAGPGVPLTGVYGPRPVVEQGSRPKG